MPLTPKIIIYIYGPTAVGKTAVADALAQHYCSAIINADVAQMYTPLTIGTAKPEWRTHSTPHYLFDAFDAPVTATVAWYNEQVRTLVSTLGKTKDVIIVVGGSGFYLHSLLFPVISQSAPLNCLLNTSPALSYTWDLLHSIDPVRARAIHPHDTYRIQRALDIWYTTGTLPSSYDPQFNPPSAVHSILLFLERDRMDHWNLIEERTDCMLAQGWKEEAMYLRQQGWESFIRERKFIGYEDIFDVFDNKQTLQEARMRIIYATRQYAKRQMSFARRLYTRCTSQSPLSKITMLRLTLSKSDLYIKQLLDVLQAPIK
jgi:tRNA dimethylallyltransferase